MEFNSKNFGINEIIKSYKNNRKDAGAFFYYYRTFDQKEIDLVLLSEGRLTLIECKAGEEYNKDDIKNFRLLRDSRYLLGKNAVICTSSVLYPLGEDAFALPASAI